MTLAISYCRADPVPADKHCLQFPTPKLLSLLYQLGKPGREVRPPACSREKNQQSLECTVFVLYGVDH